MSRIATSTLAVFLLLTAFLSIVAQTVPGIIKSKVDQARFPPAAATVEDGGEGGPGIPTYAYYASPLGSPSGTGSRDNPWDLQTALNQNSIPTGTLFLRGGTYRGKFKSTLDGGSITAVQGMPGEWPVIDGYLYTTLAVAIDNVQTSIQVADASIFVKPYNAGAANTLIVDGEALFINSISGNTINVNRAAAGSSTGAVAHAAGTTVRLAGNQLYVSGSNTIYQDIEIKNSDPLRNWVTDGAEGLRGCGIFNIGDSNTFINLIVHDNLNGIFTGSASSNTEVYGCVTYNNGQFDNTTEGKGHGMYLENNSGYSRIWNNISVNNFGLGTQLYGRTAAFPGGSIRENVWANSGAPLGATVRHQNLVVGPESQRIANILIENNQLFHPHNANGYNMNFGYGAGCDNGSILGNYFVGGTAIGLEITDATAVTATGNKFFTSSANGINIQTSQSAYTINSNTYYSTGTAANKFGNTTANANQTFAQWKTATGFDAGSTATSAAMPDTVIVKPNIYQTGRANITVYVPSGAANINVNLSTVGLSNGQPFVIRNAFDYLGPIVLTGTYNSSSPTISLPLNGAARNVAAPIGSGYLPPTTMPSFGVFVITPA